MPSMKVKGLEELIPIYKKMEDDANGIVKRGVYAGAKELGDAVKRSIAFIPNAWGSAPKGEKLGGINPIQKRGLQDGFGISAMRDDNGFVNVLIGFDGFNKLETNQYPEGQPNMLIARSVEKGTDYIQKNPFVRPVYNRTRKAAAEAVRKSITKDIENIQKGK